MTGARVALVTGASRGIGDHLVRALLGAGWAVVGLSRSGSVADGDDLYAAGMTSHASVTVMLACS